MFTKSLNKASYITYVLRDTIADIVENTEGMYGFHFKDIDEVIEVNREYDECVQNQKECYVNLIEYNRIIFMYKNLVKDYKEENELDKCLESIKRFNNKLAEQIEQNENKSI